MKRLRALRPRQRAFVDHFVATGGNATLAAKRAGYAAASAAVTGYTLLRHDVVLGLILAEVARGAPGADRALAALEARRSTWIEHRLALLRRARQRPHAVGQSILTDGDEAVRSHLIQHQMRIPGYATRLHHPAAPAATAGKSSQSAALPAPDGAAKNGSTARVSHFSMKESPDDEFA